MALEPHRLIYEFIGQRVLIYWHVPVGTLRMLSYQHHSMPNISQLFQQVVPSLIIIFKVERSSTERSKVYSAGLKSLLFENVHMNVSTSLASSGEAMFSALILNVIISAGSIVMRVHVSFSEIDLRSAARSVITVTVEMIFIMYCLGQNGGEKL